MEELLNFYRGEKSKVKNLPLKDGQILIGTSSDKIESIYIDDLNKNGDPIRREIDFSNYIEKTGDFMTGTLNLKSGYYIHAAGLQSAGLAGYIKVAILKTNGTYLDRPILLGFSQRKKEEFTKIFIKFKSSSSQDPELDRFTYSGEKANVYLYHSAPSTWELYIEKSDFYDLIMITDYHAGLTATPSIEWVDELITEIPDNIVEATLHGHVEIADKTNRLATLRNISLTGDIEGRAGFDGSTDASLTVKRKGCLVGRSGTVANSPNSWFKFASISLNGSTTDRDIIFMVTTNYGANNTMHGILKAHVRSASVGSLDSAKLSWIVCGKGITTSNFILAYKTGTTLDVELWVKSNVDYRTYQFEVISEGTRESRDNHWILYNNYADIYGKANPTEGYTQIESVVEDIKNPVQKLAEPRNIALTGDVTGFASFDGSSDASLSVMRKGCVVGQSTTAVTGKSWYKFASASLKTTYTDYNIIFNVYAGHGDGAKNLGILAVHIRAESPVGTFGSGRLKWLVAGDGIDTSKFVLAYKTGTALDVELWISIPENYRVYKFDVISEGTREKRSNNLWTLYDRVAAGGESAITSGFTQIESALVEIKNPTKTETDILLKQQQGIYEGRNLSEVFASEIANYSDVWAWIKARCTANNFDGIYIRDYIPLIMGSETVLAQVAGIDTYYNTADQLVKTHHIDFISKDCLTGLVKWNISNNNNGNETDIAPYMVSNVRDYLLNTVYPKLPEELKKVIVSKRVLLETRYLVNEVLTDSPSFAWRDIGSLWLPTEREVFGSSIWGTKGYSASYGMQYPIFANSCKNLIKGAGNGGSRTDWWIATVGSGNSTTACVIAYRGYVYHNSTSNEYRVPLCFRIEG